VNFVVHPEEGAEQRTDVDVLGVRFPFRAELLREPMEDDLPFRAETQRPFIILAEVKKDRCKLNGPWTRSEDRNMHRVLTAIGAIPPEHHEAAATGLYKEGVYESDRVLLSLCCVGGAENREVRRHFPRVPQILWPAIAAFIYRRFEKYFYQKLSHPQWDKTGRKLWKLASTCRSLDDFTNAIERGLAARGASAGFQLAAEASVIGA
jgi:hypothetical protein